MRPVLRLSVILIVFVLGFVSASSARAGGPVTFLVIEAASDQPLKLYDRPSLAATVVKTVPYGTRMAWNGTTQQAESRNWIQVYFLGTGAWITPDTNGVFLVNPGRITPGINPGATVQPMQRPITLYQSPTLTGAVLGQLPVGARLYVTDGPVIADFYNWWQVKVNGQNTQGWIADTFDNLQTVKPLQVYGVDVCDNFKIKTYGAAGWDSIMNVLPNLIPAPEKIVCLASSNLRGDKTPFVTVLTRTQGQNPTETQDTLRIFMQRAPDWATVYESRSDTFSQTVDLGLFDLMGNGKPALLWTVVVNGTGQFMTVRALRYHPVAGIQQILYMDNLYKGAVQVSGSGSIVVLQADYNGNEPNCCQTGLERWGFQWQNYEFVQVLNDKLRNPAALQGFPPQ